MTDSHILVYRNLGRRPAVHPFGCSCRAIAAFNGRIPINVARIVEMDQLLQALDVAVVEKLLLEVRPWGFGGRALGRRQGHVARCHRLHLTIRSLCEWKPRRVRVRKGAETASQESSQSEIRVDVTFRIRGISKTIRCRFVQESNSRILGKAEIGTAKACEHGCGIRGRAGVFSRRSRRTRS